MPLLARATEVSRAQSFTSELARDPIALQLLGEMQRSVRVLTRARSGEHARRLATSLRLLAAWGVSHEFDARVRQTLRDVIARDGRNELVGRTTDPAMFLAEARQLGFDGTNLVPLPPPPLIDFAARERVLDDMLARGVTARWVIIARQLDEASAVMDRQASASAGGVRRVADYDLTNCPTIDQQLEYLTAELVFWCAPWFAWVPEPCGLVSSVYLGIWLAQWWMGCP